MTLRITKNQLTHFQLMIAAYRPQTLFPKKNHWKSLTPNELWLWMVGQVMVVGSSASRERLAQRKDLQRSISWPQLGRLKSTAALKKRLHRALRETGTRFAAQALPSSQKTLALYYNFRVLNRERQGFKTVLSRLQRMGGEDRELRRVRYLMEHFRYLSSKSGRDLLMSLGMNQGTIAIDVRIQAIFKSLRIPFPTTQQLGRPSVYDATEAQIVEKVCRPLNIAPLQFDRILYQHYRLILKKDYLLSNCLSIHQKTEKR